MDTPRRPTEIVPPPERGDCQVSEPVERADRRRRIRPYTIIGRTYETGSDHQRNRENQNGIEPLTDAEYEMHVQKVDKKLRECRANLLSTELMYTLGPVHREWLPEREVIHDELLEELYSRAADIPHDGYAIMTGGLCGAGKTTALTNYAGIDHRKYLTISPDGIKKELARCGAIPLIDGLSPMEASELIHIESGHLARRLAGRALKDGKNVLWDIVMSNRNSTKKRIDDLREAGYNSISALFIDVPVEKSLERTRLRHRVDHDKYRNGEGFGGRYLFPEIVHLSADPEFGSINRRVFEELLDYFDNWSMYDNSIDGQSPTIIKYSDR